MVREEEEEGLNTQPCGAPVQGEEVQDPAAKEGFEARKENRLSGEFVGEDGDEGGFRSVLRVSITASSHDLFVL